MKALSPLERQVVIVCAVCLLLVIATLLLTSCGDGARP